MDGIPKTFEFDHGFFVGANISNLYIGIMGPACSELKFRDMYVFCVSTTYFVKVC